MGRKKKIINKTNVPQYAVERFARCVFDDIRADYAKPEIQAEFQRWLAEREQNKKTRVAKTATLVSIMGNKQIIRTHFQFGRYGSDYICLYLGAYFDRTLDQGVHFSLGGGSLPAKGGSFFDRGFIGILTC